MKIKEMVCFTVGICLWANVGLADETFFRSIQQADLNTAEAILQKDASVLEARDKSGYTPLLTAAQQNNLPMMKLLLEQGANVNAMNHKRRDILNIAISVRNPEIARLALQAGADPTLVTSVYQGSALIYATHQAELEIMQMLIAAGAPLNRVNNLGWTALLEAAILGDGGENYASAVKLLLEAGADKNIADKKGKTPLNHAQDKGHQLLIELLDDSVEQ